MAAIAAQFLLQSVSNGCLTMHDTETERRPYHLNCSCAMHKSTDISSCGCSRQITVLLPRNQKWKGCALPFVAAKSCNSNLLSGSSCNHCDNQFRTLDH
uniref:Uncharacterized protein n=1 Tax=Kalanchoe fedtschenkoi TaxID=63787 RepID=A0A7N0VG26_KALFE